VVEAQVILAYSHSSFKAKAFVVGCGGQEVCGEDGGQLADHLQIPRKKPQGNSIVTLGLFFGT